MGLRNKRGIVFVRRLLSFYKEASINFIGNVEAREIMSGAADVVVADGFTGNAVLKAIEGTGLGTMKTLKSAIMNGGLKAKLGASY